jgi:hypothetical protein
MPGMHSSKAAKGVCVCEALGNTRVSRTGICVATGRAGLCTLQDSVQMLTRAGEVLLYNC